MTKCCVFAGVAFLALGVLMVCLDLRERARSRDELSEEARVEGYAECLSDISMVIAKGGGIDEVLDFSKKKITSGFAK